MAVRLRTFKHFLDGKYWKKDPRPFSEFTVNPSVLLNVTCEPSKLRQTKKNDYRESMARSIYDSAKSKPKTKVSKFHTLSSHGLDKVYYFYTATKGVGISDTLRLFAFNDGKLASIFFRINRTPSKNYSTRLSVGSIQTIHDKRSGQLERIRVKLTGPARKGILGGFAGIRTEKQNIAMFETVLKSLQGI